MRTRGVTAGVFVLLATACNGSRPPEVFLQTNGSVAFDFDNDGYADIAQTWTEGADHKYRVWFGGPEGLDEGEAYWLPLPSGQETDGSSFPALSWVGDVNGDGYADLARGIGYNSVLWLWYGGPRDELTAAVALGMGAQSQSGQTRLGTTAMRGGDLNCDGIDDLVWEIVPFGLGIHWGHADGVALLADVSFDMNADPDAGEGTPPAWWAPGVENDSPVPVGDVNGDGCDDLYLGFAVLHGGPTGLESQSQVPWDVRVHSENGSGDPGVVGWGYLDADDHPDVIRSVRASEWVDEAPTDDRGPTAAVYLGDGSTWSSAERYVMPTSIKIDGWNVGGDGHPSAWRVGVGPDVNGDGRDDVICNTGPDGRFSDPGTYWGGDAPLAYTLVWYGRDDVGEWGTWDRPDDAALNPFERDEEFPQPCYPCRGGLIGDVNGDGYGDLVARHDYRDTFIWFGGHKGFGKEPDQSFPDFGHGMIAYTGL